MRSIVSFPVKPHIKKYLNFRFGDKFVYNHSSVLAPIVRVVVSEASKTKTASSFSSPHTYDVELSAFYLSKFGVVYSKDKLYQFNSNVDILFRSELYQFMMANKMVYNIKYRESLRDIFKIMNITEEDIKMESILRDFVRKHDKKGVTAA